ncbi:MAG: type II secretion system protein [Planctomycetota bacterium]|jgi:hypothetical protein
MGRVGKKRWPTRTEWLVVIVILACGFGLWRLASQWRDVLRTRAYYRGNLEILHRAMRLYANDYGEYPTNERWCDLLVDYNMPGMRSDLLYCHTAAEPLYYDTTDPNDEPNFPVAVGLRKEYTLWTGERHYRYQLKWSHYGLNPNAEPNGPGDIVLLFSTKGSWNLFDGPDILSTENHLADGLRGCFVLLNDGRVKWVEPKDTDKLNWGTKGKK